jgi:membrane fusion protein (multidrug efflux system)
MTLPCRQTIAAGAFFALLALTGCDSAPEQSSQASASPPPAVTVIKTELRDLRPSVSFNGRVTALERVDLQARIDGFLEQRNFTEGHDVSLGDLLFVIEKAPYEARVASARGAVETAQARLARTEIEYERQGTLVKKDVAARSKLDDATAARDEARGDLNRLQAELQQAELQLSYTDIRAPITGRIGRSLISPGNFVSPSSGTLATIVSQDPIDVVFPISQREILKFREENGGAGKAEDLAVYLQFGKGDRYPHAGRINFMDVSVNAGTDTVEVRASFPNPERMLVDGQLVTAVVEADTPQPSLVVPQVAIQIDQTGPFVLVVNSENKIEVRRVEPGGPSGMIVTIKKGLAAGDLVVTEGVQKVRPGQVVQPTMAEPEA